MLPTPIGFDRVPVFKLSTVRHGMRRSLTNVTNRSVNAMHSQSTLFSLRNVDRFAQRSRRNIHYAGVDDLHHFTKVRTSNIAHSQRNFSVFSPQNPYNAVDVATQLKALNYEGKYEEVKRLFETGNYQTNGQAVAAYKEALSNLQSGNHSKSFSETKATATGPDPNFQSADTEAAAATEAMPNMSQSTANPSPDYNQWYQMQYQYYTTQAQLQSRLLEMMQKPIPVEVASTLTQPPARYSWFKIVGGIVFGIMVGMMGTIFLISGSKTKDSEEGDEKTSGGSQGGKGDFPMGSVHSAIKSVVERFDDVKGIDEAKEELKEVVDYLKNPEKFTKLGAKLPKGVLLMGEPGTGKTLLARAVAGEAGVPFFYASGSSFDELYVGVGPKRVRMMFEDAKKVNGPCIIFIDEIDALGTSRQRILSSSYARESTLNQLLTEMDGFKQNKGIIVIGATNFPDILDAALVRPGRFDKQVVVSKPDKQGRKEIMDMYLKKTVFKDIDSDVIARGTPGFTGADLSNLINLAAIKASRKDKKAIDMKDLEDARDDVLMGIKKSRPIETPEERKQTAYHEAGHAIIATLTAGCDPVHKVTIIPRGVALGVTATLPERDHSGMSRKQALARIAMAMGGRVAEELIFGEDGITSGATSDFDHATQIAEAMVTEWGMSPKIGFVSFRNHKRDRKMFSEEQKSIVDDEVRGILDSQYQIAKRILKEHEPELHKIANFLLQEETITGDQVKRLMEGKPLSQIKGSASEKPSSVF